MSIRRFESHSTQQNIIFLTLWPVLLQLFIKNESHGWKTSCIWIVNFKLLQEMEFHSIKGALSSLRKCLKTENPLKMIKNVFHLQCSSRSDIWIFVLNFRSCQKTGLIRKIRLISKLMIPQPVNKYFQHTY